MSEIVPNATVDLLFIGFGPSSVAVLAQLVVLSRKNPDKFKSRKILLVSATENIATGTAFSAMQHKSHLMNTTADNSSLFADTPYDFVDWLRQNPKYLNSADSSLERPLEKRFVPRYVFGHYLLDRKEELFIELKKLCWNVTVFFDVVDDLYKIGNFYGVTTHSGEKFFASEIILATGNEKYIPQNISSICSANFIRDPYLEGDKFLKILSTEKVIVMGTKLSAIDACIRIAETNCETKILMVSKSGELPCINLNADLVNPDYHQSVPYLENFLKCSDHQIGETFSSILKFLKNETASLPQGFSSEFISIKKLDRSWENMMLPVTVVLEKLWVLANEDQRRFFYNEYGNFYFKLVSSFPFENATKIQRAIEIGQLTIEESLQNVAFIQDRFVFKLKSGETFSAEWLVNCSGYENISTSKSLLAQNLRLSGLSKNNGFGGQSIDTKTHQILNKNGFKENIYALGFPVKSSVLLANWFDRIVKSSKQIAEEIVVGWNP